MQEEKKTAFSHPEEAAPYLPPKKGDGAQERRREEAASAHRQLIGAAAGAMVLLLALLAGILVYQAVQPQGLPGRSLLEFEGLTYEKIEEEEEITALGLSQPLTQADCGQEVAVLTQGDWAGAVLYRLREADTRALLAVQRDGEIALYRFCYFSDDAAHTGKEILDVLTDGTELEGVDCYGSTGGWSRLLRGKEELASFEELFSSLSPAADADPLRTRMEQASWDTMLTLRCANGLTFHLSVYSGLKIAAGFRSIYPLPDALLTLIGAEE